MPLCSFSSNSPRTSYFLKLTSYTSHPVCEYPLPQWSNCWYFDGWFCHNWTNIAALRWNGCVFHPGLLELLLRLRFSISVSGRAWCSARDGHHTTSFLQKQEEQSHRRNLPEILDLGRHSQAESADFFYHLVQSHLEELAPPPALASILSEELSRGARTLHRLSRHRHLRVWFVKALSLFRNPVASIFQKFRKIHLILLNWRQQHLPWLLVPSTLHPLAVSSNSIHLKSDFHSSQPRQAHEYPTSAIPPCFWWHSPVPSCFAFLRFIWAASSILFQISNLFHFLGRNCFSLGYSPLFLDLYWQHFELSTAGLVSNFQPFSNVRRMGRVLGRGRVCIANWPVWRVFRPEWWWNPWWPGQSFYIAWFASSSPAFPPTSSNSQFPNFLHHNSKTIISPYHTSWKNSIFAPDSDHHLIQDPLHNPHHISDPTFPISWSSIPADAHWLCHFLYYPSCFNHF